MASFIRKTEFSPKFMLANILFSLIMRLIVTNNMINTTAKESRLAEHRNIAKEQKFSPSNISVGKFFSCDIQILLIFPELQI